MSGYGIGHKESGQGSPALATSPCAQMESTLIAVALASCLPNIAMWVWSQLTYRGFIASVGTTFTPPLWIYANIYHYPDSATQAIVAALYGIGTLGPVLLCLFALGFRRRGVPVMAAFVLLQIVSAILLTSISIRQAFLAQARGANFVDGFHTYLVFLTADCLSRYLPGILVSALYLRTAHLGIGERSTRLTSRSSILGLTLMCIGCGFVYPAVAACMEAVTGDSVRNLLDGSFHVDDMAYCLHSALTVSWAVVLIWCGRGVMGQSDAEGRRAVRRLLFIDAIRCMLLLATSFSYYALNETMAVYSSVASAITQDLIQACWTLPVLGTLTLLIGRLAAPGADAPRCRACGYCLTGIASSRCPECGIDCVPSAVVACRGTPPTRTMVAPADPGV